MNHQLIKATRFSTLAVLLPVTALAVTAGPVSAAAWVVDLTPQRWPNPQTSYTCSAAPAHGGLKFTLADNIPQHAAKLAWFYDAGGQNLEGYSYCLMTYRAEGLSRGWDARDSIGVLSIEGQGKDGAAVTAPLLDLSRLWLDGKEHTILVRRALPATASRVKVELYTENSAARLTIKRLEFLDRIPAGIGGLDIKSGWNISGFQANAFKPLSLRSLFNDSIPQAFDRQINSDGAVNGGERELPNGLVSVDGVPFAVADGQNLVRPHEDLSIPSTKVMALGVEVTHKDFLPIARNDAITVPVNARGSELYFLLQTEAPSARQNGSQVKIPPRFPDITSFTIRLNYADGQTDKAFPWSVSDRSFLLQRTLGSYAVPLDVKRVLKSVTLVNREWGKNVSVAAVTLNTSPRQLFAGPWQAPAAVKAAPVVTPRARPPFARRQGDKVVLGNGYYEVTADFSNGFALTGLRNLCNSTTPIALDPSSGLEVTLNDRPFSGTEFKVTKLEVGATSVKAWLAAKDAGVPLRLELRLTATNNQELQTNCTLFREGNVRPAIKFPLLKGMTIGTLQDSWLFFPQCNNTVTNKNGWYFSGNTQGYAVQFMDAYNPGEGVGVGLMTRNLNGAMLEYGSGKNEKGVSEYIRYNAERTGLADGEPLKSVTTSLVFHSGDWRQSVKVYSDWLATWYKPVKAQNKSWWLNTWLIGCLWNSEKVSWKDLHVPPTYDAKTRKFRFDAALAADRIYLGAKPEGYHFFKQVHDDKNNYNLWNETAAGTYPWLGGLANAQKMVKDLHRRGEFVSFYYIPAIYARYSDLAKRYDQKKIAARDAAGNYMLGNGYEPGIVDTITACPESEEWLNYMAQNTNKIVRDLDLDSIYLDVFPFHYPNCYAPDHGHKVPANPHSGSVNLLKKLRALYPAKTSIWTEDQAPDVPSQYLDGGLSYSGTSTAPTINPRWDEVEETPNLIKPEIDISRYTAPHFRQFCLPQGYSSGWTVMQQILFNGKGLFGGAWRDWNGDVSKVLGEQIRILRLYTDCFNADKPEHLVPTLRGDVYANKFPGKTRTLWTLLNGSGLTIRGYVIAVTHKPNAVYSDAATGKKLNYTLKGNTAYIAMKLDPQNVGCVLQSMPKSK